MNDWHFLRPDALWLTVIPVLYLITVWIVKQRKSYSSHINKDIAPYLIRGRGGKKEWLIRTSIITGLTIGIIALAGPVYERYNEDKRNPVISVSLVMNMSDHTDLQDIGSMKIAVYKLLDSLKHEKVSLVVQGGSSHILIPFTNDYRLIRSYMEWVSPEIMPAKGYNLLSLKGKTDRFENSDFHGIMYITPEWNNSFNEEWEDVSRDADWSKIIQTGIASISSDSIVAAAGLKGEGIYKSIHDIRNMAQSEMYKEELKDNRIWIDNGYMLCWMASIFLVPLFLRYKKGFMLLIPFMTLTSCSYTQQKINDTITGFYLWRGDTVGAINAAHSPVVRGILWAKMNKHVKAQQEFMKDTMPESIYNAGLAACYNGNYMEGLTLFRKVQKKRPDWGFVTQNIHKIEALIASGVIEEKSKSPDTKGESDADSYEKDKDNPIKDGKEVELWADKLDNGNNEQMNYSKEKAPRRSDVLFRQIENNPKMFLRRRLEYEYLQDK